MELPTGQKGYFVLDGLGTIVGIVDGQGNTQATYAYDPYGTITAVTGTGALVDANPYRHTTGLLDPATGYTKHGTRWNDTTTGRWTTTDPITRLGDPNQANPYSYAADNPINNVDPTGRDAVRYWTEWLFGYAVTTTCVAGATLATGGVDLVAAPAVGIGCGAAGVVAGALLEEIW
ncbi:hypothetical protein GCM10009740_02460 [Terrabacter terrae]|uniref:Teneurin-like YD-shell domain-containing protein n=1 Tax=Terrabacter terrae TaxID=318434 RepID=A0ABN2TT57_9MICO